MQSKSPLTAAMNVPRNQKKRLFSPGEPDQLRGFFVDPEDLAYRPP